jgi:uncharacterized protein
MNRPVHFEILAEDPQALLEFYRSVFGWQTPSWDGPQGYWPATTGDDAAPGIHGGFMHRHFPQSVINTISVASLEDTVGRVEAAGGRRVHGPSEIPGVGTHAYFEDPAGIMFGVLQPAAGAPSDG